jgi:hypothetical protein
MSRVILAGALIVVGALVPVAAKPDEVAVAKPKAVDRPVLSFDDKAVMEKLDEIWTEYESRIAGQNAAIEEELKRLRALAQKKGDIEEVKLWDGREKQWEATGQLKFEPKAPSDTFAKFLQERTLRYGGARETLEKEHKALVAKVLKDGNEAWAKELDETFLAIAPSLPPPKCPLPPATSIPGLRDGRYVTKYPGGWTLELQINGDTATVLRSGFNGNLQPPPAPISGVFRATSPMTYAIDLEPWHEVWVITPRSGGRNIEIQHWAGGVNRYGPATHKALADRVGK